MAAGVRPPAPPRLGLGGLGAPPPLPMPVAAPAAAPALLPPHAPANLLLRMGALTYGVATSIVDRFEQELGGMPGTVTLGEIFAVPVAGLLEAMRGQTAARLSPPSPAAGWRSCCGAPRHSWAWRHRTLARWL